MRSVRLRRMCVVLLVRRLLRLMLVLLRLRLVLMLGVLHLIYRMRLASWRRLALVLRR